MYHEADQGNARPEKPHESWQSGVIRSREEHTAAAPVPKLAETRHLFLGSMLGGGGECRERKGFLVIEARSSAFNWMPVTHHTSIPAQCICSLTCLRVQLHYRIKTQSTFITFCSPMGFWNIHASSEDAADDTHLCP